MSSFLSMSPQDDAVNAVRVWDVSTSKQRIVRIAIYNYAGERSECWIYFKVFRQRGEILLKHQQIHLNFAEVKKLINACSTIVEEISRQTLRSWDAKTCGMLQWNKTRNIIT